jgi:uncharacterized protein
MENRTEILRNYITDELFSEPEKTKLRLVYFNHMSCVSQFAALLALKRGENVELATIAGLLHDYHTFKTLDPTNHAEKGALLAREVLNELKLTNEQETELICRAIHNHSSKDRRHSNFDEVLIDADVLQHRLFNTTLPEFEHEKVRFDGLAGELW